MIQSTIQWRLDHNVADALPRWDKATARIKQAGWFMKISCQPLGSDLLLVILKWSSCASVQSVSHAAACCTHFFLRSVSERVIKRKFSTSKGIQTEYKVSNTATCLAQIKCWDVTPELGSQGQQDCSGDRVPSPAHSMRQREERKGETQRGKCTQ